MKRVSPVFLSALLTLAAALTGQAAAAGTPAGTVIQNQASASADPFTPDGPPISALSNLVRAVVSPVCSVSLTPDGTVQAPGQSVTLLPTDAATFSYRLTNAGNTESSYALNASADAASAFVPVSVSVHHDADGNGQFSDAERATPAGSLTLAPDSAATLFVRVTTTDSSRGDAFVNLSAACPGGAPADSNNVARLRVGAPPAVSLSKTFTPAVIRPGDTTTVTLVARNDGQGASRALVLGDVLNTLAAQGLSYVSGSASAATGGTSAGVTSVQPEYTADGVSYGTSEPAPVAGVRAAVASLEPAQSLTLTFRMLAGAASENRTLTNTATASTGGVTTSSSADLGVRYRPAVALGPVNNPTAPEGTFADGQVRPFGVVGQPLCFEHTLLNTGDVTGRYTLAVTLGSGQATAAVLGADGQPLAQPLTLQPGESLPVRVCYTPTTAGELRALLTVTGDRGETNATSDLIADVQGGQPTLTKTSSAVGTVKAGDSVIYTMTFDNPYPYALTGVTARDQLSDALEFVSATAGGTYDASSRAVTWNVGTLPAGASVTLTLNAKVSASAVDGQTLSNSFTLTASELPAPLSSNSAQNPIWSAQLVIVKTVNNAQAAYGDRLTYTLALQNLSRAAAITDATVTDTLPLGLVYIPGSSTLGGAPYTDPAVNGRVLTWTGLNIPLGATVQIGYAVRVTPEAVGDLVNTVVVKGRGGNATAIASNTATAKVKITPLNFAPLGDIVGYVYLDRNRDGSYQHGSDLPLSRARVILAGGRVSLTDQDGRYHFANVPYGTQALRLDPASVPYSTLRLPTEGGLAGTQTVFVRGLTSVQFPLAPVSGDIQVLRRTLLNMGELRVQKTVYVSGNRYSVQLTLSTPVNLERFMLSDPLPAGAVMQTEAPAVPALLKAGDTVLSYEFTYDGERGSGVTDPSASWRY